VVTGAQVTVKARTRRRNTARFRGQTGGFRVPEVKIGIYTVTVKANGFKDGREDWRSGAGEYRRHGRLLSNHRRHKGYSKPSLPTAPGVQSESSDIGTIVDY